MDRDEMSILYRGPSIDASYHVSVHLAEGVSEEKKMVFCGKGDNSNLNIDISKIQLAMN
jgi:hypothetical protein